MSDSRSGQRPCVPRPSAHGAPRVARPVKTGADGEVVVIMGLPGAGKSTLARAFVEKGYERLNRDEGANAARADAGARSADRAGCSQIVLDNTYVSRKSRAPVILAAMRRGPAVRCVWLSTSLEDAQINAASRMVVAPRRAPRAGGDGGQRIRTSAHSVRACSSVISASWSHRIRPRGSLASKRCLRADARRFVHNRALIVWCDESTSPARKNLPLRPVITMSTEVIEERGAFLRRYQAEVGVVGVVLASGNRG